MHLKQEEYKMLNIFYKWFLISFILKIKEEWLHYILRLKEDIIKLFKF